MKKRLRKKLKLSEFQELGFFVTGTFNVVEEADIDIFFEKIIEFANANNMQCGGGYSTEQFELFVNTGIASDENAAARQKFVEFIEAAKKEIKEFEATELLDAYYAEAGSKTGCGDDCECGCH